MQNYDEKVGGPHVKLAEEIRCQERMSRNYDLVEKSLLAVVWYPAMISECCMLQLYYIFHDEYKCDANVPPLNHSENNQIGMRLTAYL